MIIYIPRLRRQVTSFPSTASLAATLRRNSCNVTLVIISSKVDKLSKLKIWLICYSNKYWKRPNTDHVGGNDHDSFALESGKRFHLSSPSRRVDIRLVQDVVPEKVSVVKLGMVIGECVRAS